MRYIFFRHTANVFTDMKTLFYANSVSYSKSEVGWNKTLMLCCVMNRWIFFWFHLMSKLIWCDIMCYGSHVSTQNTLGTYTTSFTTKGVFVNWKFYKLFAQSTWSLIAWVKYLLLPFYSYLKQNFDWNENDGYVCVIMYAGNTIQHFVA